MGVIFPGSYREGEQTNTLSIARNDEPYNLEAQSRVGIEVKKIIILSVMQFT